MRARIRLPRCTGWSGLSPSTCLKSCFHMMLPIYDVRPLSLEPKPCEKGAWKIENSKCTDKVDIAVDKRVSQINIFFILHKTYGLHHGKNVFGHMRTAKAQISLPIQAGWSGPSMSTNRVIGCYKMFEWREKAWAQLFKANDVVS